MWALPTELLTILVIPNPMAWSESVLSTVSFVKENCGLFTITSPMGSARAKVFVGFGSAIGLSRFSCGYKLYIGWENRCCENGAVVGLLLELINVK